MASDPKSLQRLSRITAEVDRAAARELTRRLEEMERRLAALERAGPRPSEGGVDAIRVRTIEGRMADQEASLRTAREELRELRLRVEAVSTETGARANTTQMGLQEVRRLLEERTGALKALEGELRREAERADGARREAERRLDEAAPALRAAADLAEVLGPGAAAQMRRLPEALQGIEALRERLQRAEQAVGQVAAQSEGLLRAHEETAAVLEDVKRERGPQSSQALEQRLAALEKEAGRWEDLGDVLLSLREGLGALQKEAAKVEEVRSRLGDLEAHGRDIGRISGAVEALLGEVEGLKSRPAADGTGADPEMARRMEEHEKTLQKFAGVTEEVLKWMEAVEEQRRAIEGALQTLRESPVDRRLQELEIGQAKATGAIEHLLKQVDELEAGVERVRRAVLQHPPP
ncbi:MAG: hypothetical protein QXO51_07595 [Halobacteria archaeon]